MCVKISFVIPVYNAADYISTCIESILRQVVDCWELIIIDDGSTDNTLNICNSYAQIDDRIKVYSQKNCGPSIARNRGFNHSSGEWISFLDADDWIEDNYLSILSPYLDKKYDFIMYSYNEIEKGVVKSKLKTNKVLELSSRDMLVLVKDSVDTESRNELICTSRCQFWTKVYNKTFLENNNIFSDSKLSYCEDVMFNIAVYSKASRGVFLPYAIYNYRIIDGSVSHKFNYGENEKLIRIIDSMRSFINDSYNEEDAELLIDKRVLVTLINCCILDFCHKDNPMSYTERKASFLRLKESEPFNSAITTKVIKSFSFKKQVCMWLVKFNWFWAINLYLRR